MRTVHKESQHVAEDAVGNAVPLVFRNLGFDAHRGAYISEMEFAGRTIESVFPSHKHTDAVCPDPAARECWDMATLEQHGLVLIDVTFQPQSAADVAEVLAAVRGMDR